MWLQRDVGRQKKGRIRRFEGRLQLFADTMYVSGRPRRCALLPLLVMMSENQVLVTRSARASNGKADPFQCRTGATR